MKHLRFENYSRSTVSAAIDEWIFNERDRAILKRRLLDGICYGELMDTLQAINPRLFNSVLRKINS